MQTKHAALNDTQLTVLESGRKLSKKTLLAIPADAASLYEVCQAIGITHLWIYPESLIDQAGYTFYSHLPETGYSAWYPMEGEKPLFEQPQCVRVARSGGKNLLVHYPARGRWDWTINCAVDILATVSYLEERLGVPVQWSPGHLAFSTLKAIHADPKHAEWIKAPAADLAAISFGKAARDVLWLRPGGLDLADIGKWIHHVDKNSSYLSACQGVSVGCGECFHIQGEGNGKQPGIFHIKSCSYPGDLFDGITLPYLFLGEWITLDMLKMARQQGYQITIDESYVFESGHVMLKKWAADLWASRQAFKDENFKYPHPLARQNAYTTIKEIALIGVGKLAHKEQTFYHPNWWADCVGKSVVTLAYNLVSYAKYGHYPFLIYSDGLYFPSEEKSIMKALPGILDRKDELGGYKHVSSVRIDAEIVEASQTLKPGEMVSFLKKAANNVTR